MLAQAAILVLLLSPSAKPNEVTKGRQLFHDPGMGQNGVSCADCHATVENEARQGDGLIRSGHTLYDVARRPYWRGDTRRTTHRSLGGAIDVCAQLFQGGSPLEPRARRSMVAYLQSIAPRRARPPLEIQPGLEATLDYDREKYQRGDADRGRGLFYRTCHVCHPKGGAGLGPSVKGSKTPDIARKIREGNGLLRGSREPGEWSPFYGRDRLDDGQIADIAAYVETLRE